MVGPGNSYGKRCCRDLQPAGAGHISLNPRPTGGEGGIRTPEPREGLLVFKTRDSRIRASVRA
jgi:hypothetical protein